MPTNEATQTAQGVVNQWQQIWDTVVKFFTDNVWNIVKFFSILIIGFIVIWIIMVIVKRVFRNHQVDPMATRFIAGVIRFALWLLLVLFLLAFMGVEITGFATTVSAALLAVGVALRDNLANLANGLILVSSKKYHTGDYILVGSVEGSIEEINFLFTCLKTIDGKQVLMPNSTMVNSQVTNFGAYPKRRVNFTVSVAYESDVELVKKVVVDAIKSNGKVYLDPEPFCRLKTMNASSLDFFAWGWCDKEDYWDVYYDCTETIFNELKRHDIKVPFQQVEVRERTDTPPVFVVGDKLEERVEKKRAKTRKKLTLEDLEDEEGMREYRRQLAESAEEKKAKVEDKLKHETKSKAKK